jgi:hypothetical protein
MIAVAALFASLWGAGRAIAHPIGPLFTDTPMPTPRDWTSVDARYSALRSNGEVEQGVPLSIEVGIGGRAEVSVGGSIDATEGTIGPVEVGGKVLLVMEGASGVDLALSGRFSSEGAADGTLAIGRSLVPGLYAQAAVGVQGSSAAEPAIPPGATAIRIAPVPRHSTLGFVTGNAVGLHGAAALQWAPRPRLIPTLEAVVTRAWGEVSDATQVLAVPEMIYLLDINHLAVKAAVPIGLYGATDVGVVAAMAWQIL